MSYYVADAGGYIADFASIGGLAHFRAWAKGHPGPIARFIKKGFTNAPAALAEALARETASGDAEGMRVALLAHARRADTVLILSDGA